ncbi:MAG: hypothetical protein LBB57_07370, partial [Clostridiales Family XIII bacterium]|nr:hypothetical protein [Clostridiales Family XIII bacterium]
HVYGLFHTPTSFGRARSVLFAYMIPKIATDYNENFAGTPGFSRFFLMGSRSAIRFSRSASAPSFVPITCRALTPAGVPPAHVRPRPRKPPKAQKVQTFA